jgi:ATP-dependent protease ClpP protease subunit
MIDTVLEGNVLLGVEEGIVSLPFPSVIHVTEFTDESLAKFSAEFNSARSSGQSLIPVTIDSFGGQTYALLGMIDIIRSSPVPVATIAVGKAMSCGAVLLACGSPGYRFAGNFTTIMLHDIASCNIGKIEDLKSDVKHTEYLGNVVFGLLDSATSHVTGYFKGQYHDRGHADWYLTTAEAIGEGLVDHGVLPKLNVAVNVELTLEA